MGSLEGRAQDKGLGVEFICEVVPGSMDEEYRVRQGWSKTQKKSTLSSWLLIARGLIWPGPPKKCTECIQNYAPEEWKSAAFIHISKCPVGDVAPEDIYSPTFSGSSVAQANQSLSLRDGPGEERRKGAQQVLKEVGTDKACHHSCR